MKKMNFECLLLALMIVLCSGLAGCKKEKDPVEPKPDEENKIYIISDNFDANALLYKTDVANKCTYIESWAQINEDSYVPFMQCVDANGKAKWGNWLQITSHEVIGWVSTTVFDITTEGNVIDIYSAKGDSGDIMHPYITMIRPDGSFAWGENGKMFYDFGEYANNTPCEGYVAADNVGGAWIAACCAGPMMAVARVNSEGDMVTDPLLLDTVGSAGAKSNIRNPQMFVNSNNELLMIVQYAEPAGGGLGEPKINGYIDVIKISADGQIQSREQLMSEKTYSSGFRPKVVEDALGGAYVICQVEENAIAKVYAYHFDTNGKTNGFGEVDMLPEGSSTGFLHVLATLDKISNKLVCVFTDSYAMEAYTLLQTIDQTGSKGFEGKGKQLTMAPKGSFLLDMAKLVTTDDSRILMTFVNKSTATDSESNLYKAWIDIKKGEAQVEKEIKVDMPLLNDGDADSEDAITDGILRHIWVEPGSSKIYGYDLKVK